MTKDGETNHAGSADGIAVLPVGTRLDGRYVIRSVIGAGGFGVTYTAEHETLGTYYAIKENFPRYFAVRNADSVSLRPTEQDSFDWSRRRFLEEGRRLAKCRHANIVGVTNVFEENGTAYMVLDYEDGQTMKSWLASLGRKPSQSEIDRLMGPILDALSYIHAQGLLHRDIAPDNIMIRRDGQPCLIDFGAAREAIAERSHLLSAIIKPGFSPPEQFSSGGRLQGPWSDIYAFAATLYQAVTGAPPPDATERAAEDELRPAGGDPALAASYRAAFLGALDQALQMKHSERPQSVAAWREQLFATAPAVRPNAQSPNARANTKDLPPPRALTHDNRALWAALAVGVLVIGGVAATKLGNGGSQRPPAAQSEINVDGRGNAAISAQSPTTGAPAAANSPPSPAPIAPTPATQLSANPVVPSPPPTRSEGADATNAIAAPSSVRVLPGQCFTEFRKAAAFVVAASSQAQCAEACLARAQVCQAWEYLDRGQGRSDCALFARTPEGNQLCAVVRGPGSTGAIGFIR